jgi:uncharacterized protein
MLDKNADRISLPRWMDSGEPLLRTLPLASFKRLASYLYDTEGSVEVALYPHQTEQGYRSAKGTVKTKLNVICQRCLLPFSFPMESTIDLTFVQSEAEANALPEEFEPALSSEGWFSVRELVEDELLLAFPIVFRHDEAECEAETKSRGTPSTSEEERSPSVEARRNPFSELADLLSRTKE